MKKTILKWLILTALLVIADQITKQLAQHFLKGTAGIPLISGCFELYYAENTGAAFGILTGRVWLFVVFALCITTVCALVYTAAPAAAHYTPLRLVCCLLSAGAIGNMIDRIVYRYVIDFLYFSLIDFPIFNTADIFVCVGCALLIFLLLVTYREEDFNWLRTFFRK